MNKNLKSIIAVALLLLVASCKNDSMFPGYERMESGAYMKFHERHTEGDLPRIGDGVTLEMAQFFNDTMLFTTAGDAPLEIEIKEGDFVGDVTDAIRMMHVGDSASLVVLSDSVFLTVMQVEVPVEYLGKPIYYEIKLLSIKPLEVIQAEHRALLDSLRMVENEYLVGMQADKKNVVTESGLIVMEKTGKGKLAQLGDYINFDMTLCSIDGDTIINSFGEEPIEMQYGEEFICQGFNEAFGMVPEGGSMRFVIPSELGFDSVGYQGYIKPYAPLVVRLKMNEVLDQVAYDAKKVRQQAEKQAEKDRQLKQEAQILERYVKDNGITVEPTETGIYIVPVKVVEGNMAKWGDKVMVHYALSNLKGDLVESSYEFGEPMSFTIGQGQMIPAIEEALMTMSPGTKVKLVTPSSQAFGEIEIDKDVLPAYSPLVIELELVAIE